MKPSSNHTFVFSIQVPDTQVTIVKVLTSSSSRLLSSFLPVRHLSFSKAHWRSRPLFLSSNSWSLSASASAAFCDTSDL